MCNVREIDGLIAIVSVISSRCANENKKQHFTRRYQGLEPTVYPHASLSECLKEHVRMVVYENTFSRSARRSRDCRRDGPMYWRSCIGQEKWMEVERIGVEFYRVRQAAGPDRGRDRRSWKLVCGFSGTLSAKLIAPRMRGGRTGRMAEALLPGGVYGGCADQRQRFLPAVGLHPRMPPFEDSTSIPLHQ